MQPSDARCTITRLISRTFVTAARVGAIAGALLATDASAGVTVTGVAGAATAGDAVLSRETVVGDDQKVQTGDAANMSLLLEENALVELCGRSSLTLARAERGQRVVRVESGTARIVLDPSDAGQLEIHTPAAIATILGTVVYVTVDPKTGETTITSEDHDVRVEAAGASTTIRGGEQTTIRPGRAPGAPKRLNRRAIASLGDCLAGFHDDLRLASIQIARVSQLSDLTEAIATDDVAAPGDVSGPPLSEPASTAAVVTEALVESAPGDDLADPVESEFNITEIFPELGMPDMLPPCPGGVPCEHGDF